MRAASPRSILIFAPSPLGGFAEHTHYQAREVARRGIAVSVLCTPDFIKAPDSEGYRQQRRLLTASGPGLVARLARKVAGVLNYWILAWSILSERPDFVLMESNSEYSALWWVWPHLVLAWCGVIYLANFHDPVRGAILRMRWYGDVLRYLSYRILRGGLIHGPPPEEAWLPRWLTMIEAPIGAFTDLATGQASFDARARFGVPAEAYLLLAFGHVADRKNLDLLVRALASAPGVHLLVAGTTTSPRHRPVAAYRQLANEAGVGERVHFTDAVVPETEIAAYFMAADAVALTYNAEFVSQSGVLQIAALWDKPILASSGEGPLREVVERLRLGVFVAPDSVEAIVAGLAVLRAQPIPTIGFAAYREEASWRVNVDRLLELFGRVRQPRQRSRSSSNAAIAPRYRSKL
jgi:glycosyltransferase involved in cell wall biosynthesis